MIFLENFRYRFSLKDEYDSVPRSYVVILVF